MRVLPTVLALIVCLSILPAAVAQEEKKVVKEEVMLRDGTTAMVQVVKTEPQHITVKFTTKPGASGQTAVSWS